MRKDMSRVILDTYKRGGSSKYPRFKAKAARDWDLLPRIEGMRSTYIQNWGEGKSQGDNTSPLLRFLEKNTGRTWVDIWKEVCEHNDARSYTDGGHVRFHIEQYVEMYTVYGKDGGIYEKEARWGRQRRLDAADRFNSVFRFYVDPNGILCETPTKPRWRWKDSPGNPVNDPDKKYLGDGTELHRIDGLWYHVKTEMRKVWDFFRGSTQLKPVVVFKKSLNKRELKKYNLKNRPT